MGGDLHHLSEVMDSTRYDLLINQSSKRRQFHQFLSQLKSKGIAKSFTTALAKDSLARKQAVPDKSTLEKLPRLATRKIDNDRHGHGTRNSSNKCSKSDVPTGTVNDVHDLYGRSLRNDRHVVTFKDTSDQTSKSDDVTEKGFHETFCFQDKRVSACGDLPDIKDVEFYILHGDLVSKLPNDSMYGLLARIEHIDNVSHDRSRPFQRSKPKYSQNLTERDGYMCWDGVRDHEETFNQNRHTVINRMFDREVVPHNRAHRTQILRFPVSSCTLKSKPVVDTMYPISGERGGIKIHKRNPLLTKRDSNMRKRPTDNFRDDTNPQNTIMECFGTLPKSNPAKLTRQRSPIKQTPVYLGGNETFIDRSENLSNPTTPKTPSEDDKDDSAAVLYNNKHILSYTIKMPNCLLDSKENEEIVNCPPKPLYKTETIIKPNESNIFVESVAMEENDPEVIVDVDDIRTDPDEVEKNHEPAPPTYTGKDVSGSKQLTRSHLTHLPDDTDPDKCAYKCNYWLERRCPSTP